MNISLPNIANITGKNHHGGSSGNGDAATATASPTSSSPRSSVLPVENSDAELGNTRDDSSVDSDIDDDDDGIPPTRRRRSGENASNKFDGTRATEDDDSSSHRKSSVAGGSRSSGGGGFKMFRERKEKFVQKESKYIHYLRVVVVMILLLTAIAVCLVVFYITDGSENSNVISSFQADGKKVSEVFMQIATDKVGAAGSIIVAMVAHGIDHKLGWPFVTLSSFQERSAIVKALSKALLIEMSPIVRGGVREAWENYSQYDPELAWYEKGRHYQQITGVDDLDDRPLMNAEAGLDLTTGIGSRIFDYDGKTVEGVAATSPPHKDYYLPIWETSPVAKRSHVNLDRRHQSQTAERAIETNAVVFEGMQYTDPGYSDSENVHTAEMAWLLSVANRERTYYEGDIYTSVYFPIYDVFFGNRTTVGVMHSIIHWARYFEGILPETSQGVVFVLENGCDTSFTYQIDGPVVTPLGHGDLHDPKFDDYGIYASFENVTRVEDGTASGMRLHHDECFFKIRVYPSDEFADAFHSNTPMVITLAVAIVFVFTVIMFFVYDWLVERRQTILLAKATRTHQIVASFFPKHVRDQILADGQVDEKKSRLLIRKNDSGEDADHSSESGVNEAPIADLFPEASVLFADIAGFTAWSSSREPQQVFILLQNVYHAFDAIAKNRKVFKVETIGDSYVAAAGVPEAQPTHAVIMARFAWECLIRMNQITQKLESTLGPDTGELSMRFGIHSGPVTAGVLRGERSRFQLFGDTVNTASRMESTGLKGKIQCSQSTAEALIAAGKQHWLKAREDAVHAKGKGVLKTFWVVPHAKTGGSQSGSSDATGKGEAEELEAPQEVRAQRLLKHERQVDWVTELLGKCICNIVAKQQVYKVAAGAPQFVQSDVGHIPLEDLVQVISLPETTHRLGEIENKAALMKLPEKITSLLRQYVSIIASAYIDNSFHNFEHACHVTMTVHKFLDRIKMRAMNKEINKVMMGQKSVTATDDYTYMIHSDPVTHLALVLSAVIHDVDHQGVSNAQLAREDPTMAARYQGKCLAEQNSFEIAWDVFMTDHFQELRDFIFKSPGELFRFRQIVINVVLATDIFDKDLNEQRQARWKLAFEGSAASPERNALRATIVIEHIIQASDVSHIMQHWKVYQKWNRKLFFELSSAYHFGRMEANPADFWYKSELAFFDNYIIPLAKKLQDCNVFGVSSDECLNYAIRNRAEWEAHGEGIVSELVQDFQASLKLNKNTPKSMGEFVLV